MIVSIVKLFAGILACLETHDIYVEQTTASLAVVKVAGSELVDLQISAKLNIGDGFAACVQAAIDEVSE